MGDYWMKALEAAEAAEEAAQRLRRRWGREAEAHLPDAARGVKAEAAKQARMDDVRRALRWT